MNDQFSNDKNSDIISKTAISDQQVSAAEPLNQVDIVLTNAKNSDSFSNDLPQNNADDSDSHSDGVDKAAGGDAIVAPIQTDDKSDAYNDQSENFDNEANADTTIPQSEIIVGEHTSAGDGAFSDDNATTYDKRQTEAIFTDDCPQNLMGYPAQYKEHKHFKITILLALIGLILSFLIIPGLPFACVAFILAYKDKQQSYDKEANAAFILSIVSVGVNLFMLLGFLVFMLV